MSFFFSKNAGDLRLIVLRRKRVKVPNTYKTPKHNSHTHATAAKKNTDTPKMAAKRPTQIQNTNLQGDGLTRGKGLGLLLWSTTGAPPQPLLKPQQH